MDSMTEPTRRKITDYTPDPSNANRGTERGLRLLDDSIAEVGLGRSIVVDKNGVIIGGNKTQERAIDRGFEDAIEVETDGQQLVVVKRTDLDLSDGDDRARRLAYLDNRVAELDLDWQPEQLLADLEAGIDLEGIFYDWEIEQLQLAPEDQDEYAEHWRGMPEYQQSDLVHQKIIVSFASIEDVQAFADLIGQSLTEKTRSIWYPPRSDEKMMGEVWESES